MQQQENWQVEVDGNIYETDLAGLTQWIAESSLLPEDKVRRGDMPWIEAKLVPALAPYFAGKPPMTSENAVTSGANFDPTHAPAHFDAPQDQINAVVNQESSVNFGATEPNTSTGFAQPYQPYEDQPEPPKTQALPPSAPIGQFNASASNASAAPDASSTSAAPGAGKCCTLHAVREARFACRQCLSLFCEDCPRTIARVKLCPLCGDMCNPFGSPSVGKNGGGAKPFSKANPGPIKNIDPNFSFADFKMAWSYPFRFPVALLLGGIISGLFGFGIYLGLATTMVGGLFPGLMTVLVCGVVSIAIIYGCATKAVNQVAYGNTSETFMPDGEDFSIWNTILQPCFLGLSTCLVSWGPMLLVGIMIFKLFSGAVSDLQKQALKPGDLQPPQRQNALLGPVQTEQIEEDEFEQYGIANSRQSEANAVQRIQTLSKNAPSARMDLTQTEQQKPDEQMIEKMVSKMAGKLIPLILLLIVAALWGVFYFPTALTVAGYTESIGSTMNPLVGFDTMRRMGANYFKAFGTYLLLLVFSVFIYFGVSIVTAPFAAAGLGNVPAQLLGNIVSFYLYIVTACIFGLALYRSHEKLGFSVAG